MLAVIIENDAIRIGERLAITFHRTLRIPDDGRAYPLPPGLGRFPIFRVADYADRVPALWRQHGGVFIPMYQREALWLGFRAAVWKPNAVQIAVGGINAISGVRDDAALHAEPQDYIVCPDQPWIDRIHTDEGSTRQFVAMPPGPGRSVEAAATDTEPLSGLQITVLEPRPGLFPDQAPERTERGAVRAADEQLGSIATHLGTGGAIRQKIHADRYGIESWDPANQGCVHVHIVNSADFLAITGREPPPSPINARTYTRNGLPWLAMYQETEGGGQSAAAEPSLAGEPTSP